jgi:hypothetical protein
LIGREGEEGAAVVVVWALVTAFAVVVPVLYDATHHGDVERRPPPDRVRDCGGERCRGRAALARRTLGDGRNARAATPGPPPPLPHPRRHLKDRYGEPEGGVNGSR